MRLLCKGAILLGAVLSVVHAGDYAYHLWRQSRRTSSLIVICLCVAVAVLAVAFARGDD